MKFFGTYFPANVICILSGYISNQTSQYHTAKFRLTKDLNMEGYTIQDVSDPYAGVDVADAESVAPRTRHPHVPASKALET